MNESAEVFKESIDLSFNNVKDQGNMIAIKFSAMANYPELLNFNIAEKYLIDLYYEIDSSKQGKISILEVTNYFIKLWQKFEWIFFLLMNNY